MEYFLRALRIDLQPTGIAVSIIRPGFVDTPLTQKNDFDMPTLLSPSSASKYIEYAIEKRKNDYNFPPKLSIPLTILSFFPRIWENTIAPKFRKDKDL